MPKKFKYMGSDTALNDQMSRGARGFDSPFKDGVKLFKPQDGKNRIRVLPRTWTAEDGRPAHWSFPVHIHYGVGPDNASYLCLDKVFGKPCPICEARNSGDLTEEQEKELRPSLTYLVYVIDRTRESAGPLLFKMSPSRVHKVLCDQSRDEDTNELILIDHPDEGYDVTFNKSGTGLHTQYEGAAIARRKSFLSEDEDEANEWLDFIQDNPIPDCLETYSYDYINKVFGGAASADGADDDEDFDDVPFRQDVSNESLDEDEADEPAPRRRRRVVDDEDGDDTDIRDEVDDGLPARRRRRTVVEAD